MGGFNCRYFLLLAFLYTLDRAFSAVDRNFQQLDEKDVEEFSMSLDETVATEDDDDSLALSCGRIQANLTVTNGGPWGTWGPIQLCADGSYAVGYDMKIESKKHIRDNTALNAIYLICESPCGKVTGGVTSTEGHWGSWVGRTRCKSSKIKRNRLYLTSFDLQVQAPRKGALKDDTAANYVKFKCRDLDGKKTPTELVKSPGHGSWGTWGSWSAECPDDTAICGIRTRVEKPRGFFHDDTALNDVKFYCCR